MEDETKQYGFVYSEETLSPDGRVKVVYGYNDGEKSPTTIEPRVIDLRTGEVLVDLWRNWCQGSVQFLEPGKLRITVHDAYHRELICEAEIDIDRRMFALANSPSQWQPLSKFRETMLEMRRF